MGFFQLKSYTNITLLLLYEQVPPARLISFLWVCSIHLPLPHTGPGGELGGLAAGLSVSLPALSKIIRRGEYMLRHTKPVLYGQ